MYESTLKHLQQVSCPSHLFRVAQLTFHLHSDMPISRVTHVRAALVTPEALKLLFAKLAKFKLSGPELLMIANLRPEAYAHLTPLIYDVYTRFDETQLTVSPIKSPTN